jgi:hypothetical protein
MEKEATLKQVRKVLEIFANVSAEKMQEILESGLLADIVCGDISRTNRHKFRKSLGLHQPRERFSFDGCAEISASKKRFIAKEKFVEDNGPDAKIKILNLDDAFKRRFLGKIDPPQQSSARLQYVMLKPASKGFINNLGGEGDVESSLYEMFFLLEKQGHGEAGPLLTNCYWNIFFIRDLMNKLCTVSLLYGMDGWEIYANDNPDGFGPNNKIFSKNFSVL